MRPSWCSSFPPFIFLLASTSLAGSQELSSQPETGGKVCVAEVNNRTGKSLLVERMTERLARSLNDSKLIAVVMDSATTGDRELHPTPENSEELKRRECNYLLLTQVADPRAHPSELKMPEISIGGKAPNVDASDRSGTPPGENLDVRFALFRPGSPKAGTDTSFPAQPSANVSDSLMQAMDRVASRVEHDLKKK